jgi:hypothetical protein
MALKQEKLQMKKRNTLLLIAFWLVPVLYSTGEIVFAGQIGCQTGAPNSCVRDCSTPTPAPAGRDASDREQRQFAAAQMRNERPQPPGAGRLRGGDTETRSNFSFFLSILVLVGGIWALIALLRQRLGKRLIQSPAGLPKTWKLAFKPQFALSIFGFLFAAAIIGGILTEPSAVNAEKRDKRDKSKMTGLMNPSNKPVFKTAQAISGTGTTQIGAPVFDAAGNLYVRGGFTGNLSIGSSGLQASRFFDAFVAKYDASGNALWARQATGATGGIAAVNSIEGATALAVDGSGNVYIGGAFVKTITLQGGANPSITLTDGATGADANKVNYEPFVAKYDWNGNLLWARGGNTNSPKNADNLETGQNGINQIVFDASGNPYISGFVSGTNFLNSATANAGQSDIALARLDPATGAVIWKQIIGGANDDNGLDLKIDGAGNLYLIGNFGSATITFPTDPATTFTNTDDSTATFIAKFSSSGVNLWARELDNASIVGASQIALNSAGEIFLTGYFIDSATFGDTTLFETEGNGEDEESLGGYLAKMDANGDFVWAEGFGGLGEAIALDAAGRVYVVGTFYDGGTFGFDTPNEEALASFGGEDLFVARYDSNGNFDWAKPIAGSGVEGTSVIGNPSDPNAGTENNYNALGIAYNPARGTMFVSGDFQRAVALDCLTLTTPNNIQSYIAEISGDSETTSCRVWNGLDEENNDFDSPDNWNGGVLPSAGDSVYVPYTGNDFDPPTFNPASNISLSNLTIADDRILTLEKALTINNRLDLLGGFVDAESFPLMLGAAAQTFSINDGLVLGRVQKQFAAGAGAFTFPVGTAGSDLSPKYSPVTLSNIIGTGTFSVTANEGAYPNTATNLPANRANRWWNLSNGGLTQADLTFQYVEGDITQGMENQYRAYRIPSGGGAATVVNSTINTTTKTVSVPGVSQFSDWTLAQPIAPTAAAVSVGGRVTDRRGRGIASANVLLTEANGQVRTAQTNFFGFYQFEAVAVGQTYVFNVWSKRARFAPRVVSVSEQINDLDFAAQ